MKRLNGLFGAAVLAASISPLAMAQQASGAEHKEHHAQPSQQASSAELAEGEVRRVDKSGGRITLRHGEIKNLDMPPMTMVFGVSDAAMLDKVKAGDKVRFRAAGKDGKFTVTEIQATP